MSPSHLETIRRHCPPLEPILTTTEPALKPLGGIQAVLFDVYGTLFISASGDVGTVAGQRRAEAFQDALLAVGVQLEGATGACDGEPQRLAADQLLASIHDAHQQAHSRGIEFPEVDIVAIWGDTIQRLHGAGLLATTPTQIDLASLAVEYEVRVNPTWPMPGAADSLRALSGRGLRLGIISNAQFFTRELFPALLHQTAESLGFEPALQFYSYQTGWAKPGSFLYEQAAEALLGVGVPAGNVLYIGNDMLNDVAAAHSVGFQTALFAGDARSLRLRNRDDRVAGIVPDLIVTDLSQLMECIE